MLDHIQMSIFAMDSYNRGYDVGIEGLGNLPFGAEITIESDIVAGTPEVLAGFYAIAYKFGSNAPDGLASKVVISYRGTDNIFGSSENAIGGDDVANGWFAGQGVQTDQLGMALEFYEQVKQNGNDPSLSADDIILTGHSLGGGLAGFVSSLTGSEGYGYDHMPYHLAAQAFLDDSENAAKISDRGYSDPPSFNSFHARHVDGEILQSVRDGTIQIGASNAVGILASIANGMLPGNIADDAASVALNALGLDTNPGFWGLLGHVVSGVQTGNAEANSSAEINPHIDVGFFDVLGDQSRQNYFHRGDLVPTMLYAEEFHTNGGWVGLAEEFHLAYSSNALGSDAGSDVLIGGTNPTTFSGAMGRAIAYSALDEGDLVFGNSGIRVMFNDLDEIGAAVEASDFLNTFEYDLFNTSFTTGLQQSLVNTVVQYGGELAIRGVESPVDPNGSGELLLPPGVVEVFDNGTMQIELSSAVWNVGKNGEVTSGPIDLWNWLYLATTSSTAGDPFAVGDILDSGFFVESSLRSAW